MNMTVKNLWKKQKQYKYEGYLYKEDKSIDGCHFGDYFMEIFMDGMLHNSCNKISNGIHYYRPHCCLIQDKFWWIMYVCFIQYKTLGYIYNLITSREKDYVMFKLINEWTIFNHEARITTSTRITVIFFYFKNFIVSFHSAGLLI
jgi:hypothetical protein